MGWSTKQSHFAATKPFEWITMNCVWNSLVLLRLPVNSGALSNISLVIETISKCSTNAQYKITFAKDRGWIRSGKWKEFSFEIAFFSSILSLHCIYHPKVLYICHSSFIGFHINVIIFNFTISTKNLQNFEPKNSKTAALNQNLKIKTNSIFLDRNNLRPSD